MSTLGGGKWRIPKGSRLIWRSWDSEAVVYHTGSGNTHLLDELSADVLRLIEKQSQTFENLKTYLTSRQFSPSDGKVESWLEELIDKLHSLELIEAEPR